MNNTLKEIKENPLMEQIMSDSLRANLIVSKSFCNDIAEYWGDRMPLMTCEEVGELIKAISKFERDNFSKATLEDLINEMGDVIVSILSLASKYKIPYEDIMSRCDLKMRMCYNDHHPYNK